MNLVDGGNNEGDADSGATDAVVPVDDASGTRDGSTDPIVDASTSDSGAANGYAPEALAGRWASVEQAVLRTCAGPTGDNPFAIVDGPGTYKESQPIALDAQLNATFIYAAPDCRVNCDAINRFYAFLEFDGETLRAERLDEAAQRRYLLEVAFSDANHFDGFITIEGLSGVCACGGDACEPLVHAIRATR